MDQPDVMDIILSNPVELWHIYSNFAFQMKIQYSKLYIELSIKFDQVFLIPLSNDTQKK